MTKYWLVQVKYVMDSSTMMMVMKQGFDDEDEARAAAAAAGKGYAVIQVWVPEGAELAKGYR